MMADASSSNSGIEFNQSNASLGGDTQSKTTSTPTPKPIGATTTTTTTTSAGDTIKPAEASFEPQHNEAQVAGDEQRNTTIEDNVQALKAQVEQLTSDKSKLELEVESLSTQLRLKRNELEREVERRCDLEQRFTEDAKRSTDQIEELIANSNHDDARLHELQKRIQYYTQETSTMIESFTTHREVLASQLLELRHENDYLLGKFLAKHRDLQNEAIDLPQTMDDLQFYCLNLSEKLILATLAKERLEEKLMQNLRGG